MKQEEESRLYTYYRGGKAYHTPSETIAFKRADEGTEITYIVIG